MSRDLRKWREHTIQISAGRGFWAEGVEVQRPWRRGPLSVFKELQQGQKGWSRVDQWDGGRS